MSGFITSYNSSTGALVINIEAVNGSGTFASWNVKSPAHAAVCVTNSQIVGNYVNVPGHSVALVAGPGVFVDAGCTGSGADTNTYYGTSSAGTDDGRSLVCSASNWTAGSRTNCAFPFRPTFLTWETHDDLVQQAHDAGFCGAGTSSDPISECLPRLAMIEAGAAM
jgi:hypothetical protein